MLHSEVTQNGSRSSKVFIENTFYKTSQQRNTYLPSQTRNPSYVWHTACRCSSLSTKAAWDRANHISSYLVHSQYTYCTCMGRQCVLGPLSAIWEGRLCTLYMYTCIRINVSQCCNQAQHPCGHHQTFCLQEHDQTELQGEKSFVCPSSLVGQVQDHLSCSVKQV